MAEDAKIYANGEQLNPETVASQVRVGGRTVEAELAELRAIVETLQTQVDTLTNLTERVALRSKFDGVSWTVFVEDWDDKYADVNTYRLCAMHKRTKSPTGGGKHMSYGWRVPMFYELHPHPNDPWRPQQSLIPATAVEPVQRLEVARWSGNRGESAPDEVLFKPLVADLAQKKCQTANNPPYADVWKFGFRVTSYVGVAMFKHTGRGQYGWERISNIAGLRSSMGGRKNITNVSQRTAFSEV